MKKKLALLLAVVMVITTLSFAFTVSAAAPIADHSVMLDSKLLDVKNEGSDTSYGIWGGAATTEEAFSGTNAIKLVGNGSYANYEMWSGGGKLSKDNTYYVSFYVKGTAGTSVSFDFEGYGAYCSATSYTLAGSDWEKVEFAFAPTVAPNEGDHTANGYPFRVYTLGTDTFYIDDVAIWSTKDAAKANSVTVDTYKTNWSYDGAADDTDRGSWPMDSAAQTAVDGAVGKGTKLTKTGSNNGVYFWCGKDVIVKDKEALVTFYVKGTAGESVMFDFDDGSVAGGSHTFATNDWEAVAFTINPSKDFGNKDCGFSFRVYGSPSEFCFDELHIATLVENPPVYTDLVALEGNESGGFVEVQSKKPDKTYAALYQRANLKAGQTYTVSADVMSNNLELNLMVDLEGQGGVGAQSINPSAVEAWETKSVTITPNADGNFPLRAYLNQTDLKEGEMLIKNLCVKDAGGNVVAEFTGKEAPVDGISWVAGNAKYYEYKGEPEPEIEYTNLFKKESCKDGGFMAFEPSKDAGYAAYYMRAKLNPNEEYTLKFKMIANVPGSSLLIDLEGNGGVSEKSVGIDKVDTWEEKSVKIQTAEDYKAKDGDIKEMGWPMRIYNVNPVASQIFIDDVVLTDSKGNEVFSQNFNKNEIEGVVTWMSGKSTYIPAGFVPEEEGEVLGYNELINGDFEKASEMKYWWNRNDWNGGYWQREEGKGVDGSAALVGHGKGTGLVSENAGCFYTIMGEGKEASLSLKAGKTYVLKYQVFRPEGVDSYTYIDINEGQVTTAAATKNGEWETVTARFVAPEGALKIRLVANGLATGEEVYVDNIELREVGGDPNGSPKTGDDMPVMLLVLAAVVSVGACAVIITKKHFAK